MIKPCYFSSQGERPFRYSDDCRGCLETKHYLSCDNYIPSHSQQNPNTTAEGVKTGEVSRITPKVTIRTMPEKALHQSADAYSPIYLRTQRRSRSLPLTLEMIRRATDGGCV